MRTVLSSVSARPNFVKLASVHHALAAHGEEFKHVIVHTGQHYNPLLSDFFFKQLGISQPDYNLGVKGGADREAVIQATAEAMKPKLEKEKPDIILVYGDVNGGVGAARAANELGFKIGHVEAGLRSGDLAMPEEHNRIEIDQLADLLFVTEKSGGEHLKEEKAKGKVFFVGNTMIDTLIRMESKIIKGRLPIEARRGGKFAVATLHRPSNVDNEASLKRCMDLLREIGIQMQVHLPIHPRLKLSLQKFGYLDNPGLRKKISLHPPRPYLDFLILLAESAFVITDSGGIQEEATFLGKRCFTLRRNTERPSTIESGSNVLIDPEKEEDRKKVLDFAKSPREITVKMPPLWDGKAGERIAEILLKEIK